MKRYFIILIALVISFALPVFAGTPTAENAPAASEEDAWLWLNSLSEEELIQIFGQVIKDDGSTADGAWESEDLEEWVMITRELKREQLRLRLLYEASVKAGIKWSWDQFLTAIGSGALGGVITVLVFGPTSATIIIPGVGEITLSGIAVGAVVGALTGGLTYFIEWLRKQISN